MDNLIEMTRVNDKYYTKDGFNLIHGKVAELPMTEEYFDYVQSLPNPNVYDTTGIIVEDN